MGTSVSHPIFYNKSLSLLFLKRAVLYKNIFQIVFYLIANPQKGWERVSEEKDKQQEFTNNFLFPIFGLIALSTFVGAMWLQQGGEIRSALSQSIVATSSIFGGFYLASYLHNKLLWYFTIERTNEELQQFVGYSSVMLYLFYVINPLLHNFSFLWLILLYSQYIIYIGAKRFLCIADKYRIRIAAISNLIILLAPLAIHVLLHVLLQGFVLQQ